MGRETSRFAPSPTGRLHLGHAYAALVAEGFARAGGGTFLVRIEDLDAGRSRGDLEAAIFEDLAWLGLASDLPPVRQSDRGAAYAAALARLEAEGLVYPCVCTRKEIAAEIAAIGAAPQEGAEAAPPYPGTCRRHGPAAREAAREGGRGFALRLDTGAARAKLEREGRWPLHFEELGTACPGRITAAPERLGDIVLARKDAPAAYHLAVVVDDAEAGVTLVTRGEDLAEATHIQVLLQALLGLATPRYFHHALVRDGEGKRLAKRADALTLAALQAGGLTPEGLLARLPPLPDFACSRP